MIIFCYFMIRCLRYTTGAAAQSAAGIGVPKFQLITGNISSMFPVIARTYLHSMVVRAGLPQGRPVSIGPGNANPVRAATNEIGVSGGSINISPIEAALWLLPFPAFTRDFSLHLRGCRMYDNSPLTPEELADQCRALAYAIIRLEHPYAEELLMYVLWERIHRLHSVLTTEVSSDE